jgi:hypothetical protein
MSGTYRTNIPFTLSFTDKNNRTITTEEPCLVSDSIKEDCIMGIGWCRKTKLGFAWNSNHIEFTNQMDTQEKDIKIQQKENIPKELQPYK